MPSFRRLNNARRYWLRPKYFLAFTAILFMGVSGGLAVLIWDPFELSNFDNKIKSDAEKSKPDSPFEGNVEDGTAIPKPSNCSSIVRYKLKRNFCAWERSLEECYRMFLPLFLKKPSWVFLGDYGMSQVSYFVSLRWPFASLEVTSHRDACKNSEYFRIPRRIPWIAPNHSLGEGPLGYGKDHPYCTDSQKCWNVLLDVPTSRDEFVEFLVVEYARDVALPTQMTRTTQETVALYLSTKSPSVCIASAGLHDAFIKDPVTGKPLPIDVYIHNVDDYITLLARTCRNVIWIGLPAIIDDSFGGDSGGEETLKMNCKLQEYNNAVYGLIELRGYDSVYVLDVWEKSLRTRHVDKLYLSPKYYASLARLFVMLMDGSDVDV